MFTKVLIANRGAIACRIIRTLGAMGVASVAVYADADRDSAHVRDADEAWPLGVGAAATTYLDMDKILAIARDSGAEAIHPGYGFLSENPNFARRCAAAGIVFLGPMPEQMEAFGLKHRARAIAADAGVPLVPGSELVADLATALAEGERLGFPLMLKATAGGGGIGMQCCANGDELHKAFDSVRRLAHNNFADGGVFLERYIARARHIEVQIFGDGCGNVISLGERDCSSQRRNQKVVEECPAPNLPKQVRQALHSTAEQLMAAVRYRGAGTVEFIYDAEQQQFYFLEVNTRLQVEHGVTELVWGVDIVRWMVELGAGELAPLAALKAGLTPVGHAMQVRLYAEDANKQFQPSAGLLTEVQFPAQDRLALRIDHFIQAGLQVSPLFDPMLAKVMVHRPSRAEALAALAAVLAQSRVSGIETNLAYLRAVVALPALAAGEVHTRLLNEFSWQPTTLDVLAGGTQTTVQDYPGRSGYWHVGIPPSGPMDSYSFCLANRLLGNAEDAAGLEITLNGPTLRFNCATTIALCGAPLAAELDGEAIPFNCVVAVAAGQTLRLGKVQAAGARAYLAIAGGLDLPLYLGSRATFTLGQFGGHGGRALQAGDVLHLLAPAAQAAVGQQLAPALQPELGNCYELRVLYGPHGAPDFFTDADIDTFFASDYEVHYNSSRTGVRLIGAKPQWARSDGGEAGMHPSNIHDNAYAFGTIDFTGDMPVILGPDGPSLGGFVCPATVIKADRWKLGQLKAGDKVRFVPVSLATAAALLVHQQQQLAALQPVAEPAITIERGDCIIKTLAATDAGPQVVYRQAGDEFLLIEYGPHVLDVALRFRVHALMLHLQALALPGLRELTPGVRSLQIHFDSQQLGREALLALLEQAEDQLDEAINQPLAARVVYLPLSWDDEACRQAIAKYMQSVRADAPWCPSNIEFIRRINGLADVQAVKQILFDASYLVMGLGDVYLGAPVATPLDPRHRLVTTKYNPARTWTAENSVGIGGSYLCVYGMEGPGGYQFVGRTLQMWNRYRQTAEFSQPWLLRFFDQIRFYEVSAEELKQIRSDFPEGRYPLKIEPITFSLAEYQAMLAANREQIATFTAARDLAFQQELERWISSGQINYQPLEQPAEADDDSALGEQQQAVESPVSGSLWQLNVAVGDRICAGDTVAVIESMKMEIELQSAVSGTVTAIRRQLGQSVNAGQPLLVVATD